MTTRRSGNPTAIANEPIPWQNLKIKIYKHLGSGVMGSVFLIDWQKSKKVALKLVPLTQNSSWHLCKVEVDNLIKIRQISSEVPNFVKMLNNCIVESIPAEVCKKFQLLQNTKYSVIILENGGEPLAKKIFKSDEQIISAVAQTMLAMCVAKRRLDFQHVDIHDKNILVSETESEIMEYVVDGRKVRVRACGVKVTIIDLQLSRFKYYPSRYDLRRLCDVFIMLAKKTNEESARKVWLNSNVQFKINNSDHFESS